MIRILQVVAMVLVALCLVPVGAHLLELPGKMAMDKEAYYATQRIYNGWALFGIVDGAAIVATAVLAWMLRDQRMAMGFAAASAGLIVASLAAFFALTFPGNVTTSNWTVVPDNWESLRRNWETGHAAAAVLTFVSMIAIAVSVVVAD